MGDPEKGTAILDVAPELLATVMHCLPATFVVVGSERADKRGYVRLVLESEAIAPGYRALATCEISDRGCQRVVELRHVGKAEPAS